ncbi:methyl-accepting chemotaxis protein-1 (serine sensor receptor) [Pseudoxanthomonas sp. 3HH-4]|uniref:methyl-accepting chemotaxis protein n=1 Tax=Pseudoxanthomonas sp. 3HH-4 TaxID=1690214 RepID=UPI0011501CFB|nr:methyl-accepting chemotaxis protein [Pseudoxanthomonas sp. 3HH-4]TQM06557.1 methyl-accepting chemotaxis protein-1 (serine sensor receptor) [Pseudoxanthomonas sp. 3HH-4]
MSSSIASRPLGLQTKLLGALTLGLAVILLCALAGLGSAWLSLSTEVPEEVAQAAEGERLSRDFRVQVQEWKNILIRGHDEEQRTKYVGAFDQKGREVAALAKTLSSGIADPQARRLAADFAIQHRELEGNYRAALVQFAAAGYDTQEGDRLVKGMDRQLGETLEALVARTKAIADAAVVARSQEARRMLVACAALSVVAAVVLVLVLAWWIRRSVIRPVVAAAAAARAVAAGRLDKRVEVRSGDEIGQLGTAMVDMTATLQGVIAAQGEMALRHDEGRISFRMDDSRFPGEYGRMVRDTNALVASHIAVMQRLVEIMQCYAVGDLSIDMEALPGEKAALTDAMRTTKANLSAINAEIRQLAQAAASGDFSRRGDTQRYQHDFRNMVDGLNRLMETTDGNLADVSSLLQAIARGDLTARMEGDFHGVFASMRDDANATVAQLRTIVRQIQGASSSINTAAGEIAAGNSDLSRRTEQQAANLEETAASMEELTSTVRQNAESARQANQLAIGAASVASEGGTTVARVVTTMTEIEQSSRKIAEIISVIDGIAFQTNILALNAAVEAARAGEQGRGFAVVASEVRTLAQRSANAAKEIKGLIETSVDKVADGSALVSQAGATMGEIVTAVQRVTDIMAEISAASQEQSAGIEQVNQAIMQMDETTQQNAALVEEASAAARSMEDQARELIGAVNVFVLDARASPGLTPGRVRALAAA